MNIQEAIKYGLFVRAAEQVGDNGDPTSYQPPNGYTLVQAIFANDLQTDISPVTDYVPFGFIAQSPAPGSDFVVAIRGTDNIWEWVQDARFEKVTCPFLTGSGDTDDGFTALYSSLRIGTSGADRPVVDFLGDLLAATPNATLTLCGDSLGAALATLLALDLVGNRSFATPTVYTFASPNVGDGLFAATYNRLVPNTWRIVDQMDIITHLPPEFLLGYMSVGQSYTVTPGQKVKLDPLCYHDLTTYLYLLSLVIGGPVIPLDPGCNP